ncbi:hypothetical protein [Streptomyces sp. NPDC048603]|uniref:hypothetical protein n=1 Tax=Streptomyces sp. NPDC048603 TaxID=3365577 RepID=UPI003711F4AA
MPGAFPAHPAPTTPSAACTARSAPREEAFQRQGDPSRLQPGDQHPRVLRARIFRDE